MNVTVRDVLISVLFLMVGWMLHMLWDGLMDWIERTFGNMGGVLWDLCAIVGVVVVCLGIGFGVQQGWLTG